MDILEYMSKIDLLRELGEKKYIKDWEEVGEYNGVYYYKNRYIDTYILLNSEGIVRLEQRKDTREIITNKTKIIKKVKYLYDTFNKK